MDFTHFKAGKDDSGRRLDKIIRRFLSEENLSSLYKSLRKGLIKVNGKKSDGNFRISEGDDIQIADFLLPGKQDAKVELLETSAGYKKGHFDLSAQPDGMTGDRQSKLNEHINSNSPLSKDIIVFKNEFILILNKPYDIPVQPSSSSKGNSLAEIVQKDYETSHEKTSLSFRSGPLHRLDRKTTGLIAFSQSLEGAKWFSEKIKTHEIQKVYLAILEGNLTKNKIWEDRIQKTETQNKEGFHTVKVSFDSEEGKSAHTEVMPVSHGIFDGKEITLARILITTGRTHQIRSQCAYHGFPLLGDTAYGGRKIDSKKIGQDFFLHASELHFPKENPLALPEKLTAPSPKAFLKIIEKVDF